VPQLKTESDRAKEITEEFYPDSASSSEDEEECFAAPDDVGDEDAVQDKEREGRIRGLATRLGYTEAKLQMLLGPIRREPRRARKKAAGRVTGCRRFRSR